MLDDTTDRFARTRCGPLLPFAPLRAGLAGTALLLAFGASGAGAQRRGPVEIPSGWSDSYFDKLDSAKAPVASTTVFSQIDQWG